MNSSERSVLFLFKKLIQLMQQEEINPSDLKRNWILAALMMTMILAAMDNAIVSTAIPQIVGDLGGFSKFNWLYSIYLLVQTITIPLYGKLADLKGRKSIMLFGVIFFLVGSTACGLAWSMNSLIVFRGIQAIGAGAILATVNTIAGDIYTVEERAKIQGWLSSVWAIAAVAGPALGGAIVEYTTWRWIFFINIPFGIVSVLIIIKYLIESPTDKQPHIDWKGGIAMLVTGTLILFELMQGGKSWPWISYQSLGVILLSALLVAITFRIERKAKDPILPRWIWKERELIGSNLATLGLGAIMIGPSIYLAVFAQTVTGVGAILAGFILASMSFTWPISSGFSGKVYLKVGFRNSALIGMFIAAIGALGFYFIPYPGPVWMLFAVQMIMGAGFGLMSTPLLVGEQSIVSYNARGTVTGTNMFCRYAGQSIGAALVGVIFNRSLVTDLAKAPDYIKENLPPINQIVDVLKDKNTPPDLLQFLKESFFQATHVMYIGLFIGCLLTIIVLFFTPKKFKMLNH